MWLEGEDGPTLLNFVAPGEIIGEINAVMGWGCSANITAIRASRMLAIEAAHFVECLRSVPLLSFNLARLEMWRLCANGEAVLSRASHNLTARVARQLLLLAARFPDSRGIPGLIDLTLPHHDLADIIGASRPKVNAALRQLTAAKLVQDDTRLHRITVLNPEGLARLCGGKNGGDLIFRTLHGLSPKPPRA